MRGEIFDLLPFAREHYYHPDMHGSWSIKHVLPTIAPELDYSNLEVRDGGMAQTGFRAMLGMKPGSPERKKLREALLAYCKRDTLAMVRLVRFFAGEREPIRESG
jgi:hypothetical protein